MKLIYPHKFKLPKEIIISREELNFEVDGWDGVNTGMNLGTALLKACKYKGKIHLAHENFRYTNKYFFKYNAKGNVYLYEGTNSTGDLIKKYRANKIQKKKTL